MKNLCHQGGRVSVVVVYVRWSCQSGDRNSDVVVFQAIEGESRRQLQDCDVGHHQPNTAAYRGDTQYTQISFTTSLRMLPYLYHRLVNGLLVEFQQASVLCEITPHLLVYC